MKLATLFTIVIFFIALVGSIMAASNSIYSANKVLKEHIQEHLESVAELKAQQVKFFLEAKKGRIVDFSSDGFIKNSLIKLRDNLSEETMEKLNNHLIVNKMSIDEDIYEIMVFDVNGEVVGTTDPEEPSYNEFNDLIFLEGKKGIYIKEVFYDKEFEKEVLTFSNPILDGEEFLGVIVIKIPLEILAEITTEKTGFGETDEVYIVNNEKFLLTPSKFLKGENKGILTQIVDTENSRDCLEDLEEFLEVGVTEIEEHEEEILIFKDYRGEDVFGSHNYIEEIRWCLLVEIDKSEAIDIPRIKFIRNQIMISIFFLVFFTLVGFFIGKFLDKKYLLKKKGKNDSKK